MENIFDINQYFKFLTLNDKHREQLFGDMINTLYKTPKESILNISSLGRSQKDPPSNQSS